MDFSVSWLLLGSFVVIDPYLTRSNRSSTGVQFLSLFAAQGVGVGLVEALLDTRNDRSFQTPISIIAIRFSLTILALLTNDFLLLLSSSHMGSCQV